MTNVVIEAASMSQMPSLVVDRIRSARWRRTVGGSAIGVTCGPLDILQGVAMLLAQRRHGHCRVENQYRRAVPAEGNALALAAIEEVFELRPHFEWRGLGFIPYSGLRLNAAHARFDAENRFAVPGLRIADPKACQCGEVLKGAIRPWECKVFGTACTPQTPIGTCMVSSEGACAAFYNYGRHSQRRGTIPVRAG